MSIGIRTINVLAANQSVNTSTALVAATGLTFPLAAGKAAKFRFWVPFTLAGTASGAKFQVVPPTSPTLYLMSWWLYSGASTGSLAGFADQTTSAAFSNALASAANHLMVAEAYIIANTAGNVVLQFAQLVSDAANITLLQGATMDITAL